MRPLGTLVMGGTFTYCFVGSGFRFPKETSRPTNAQVIMAVSAPSPLEEFAADRTGTILDYFVSVVERTGNTFEQIILGARGINTVDPKNIEAVLSTLFDGW